MKKAKLALALFLAVGLVTAGFQFVNLANARTIVVPNDYSTIQNAINAANNEDTIIVKSGYYPETLMINKSLTLIGQDREHTIIDAQKQNTVIEITSSNVTFSNFTLGNTAKAEGYNRYATIIGMKIENYVANCYIAENRLVDVFGAAFWIPWTAYNNTIKNNILINCSQLIVSFASNNNNIIEGNQEVESTNMSSPFHKVPEFPPWIILPLFITITLLISLVYFKKHKIGRK